MTSTPRHCTGVTYRGHTYAAEGNLHVGFEKQDGKPEQGEPGAFDGLDALTRFVATANELAYRLAVPQLFHSPRTRWAARCSAGPRMRMAA